MIKEEKKNYFIGVVIGDEDGEAFLDEPFTGTLRAAKRECVKYYGKGIYTDAIVHLIIVNTDYKVVSVRTQYHGWINVVDYKFDNLIEKKYGSYRYDFDAKAEHAWIKIS